MDVDVGLIVMVPVLVGLDETICVSFDVSSLVGVNVALMMTIRVLVEAGVTVYPCVPVGIGVTVDALLQ
jgi:hypothetical protein